MVLGFESTPAGAAHLRPAGRLKIDLARSRRRVARTPRLSSWAARRRPAYAQFWVTRTLVFVRMLQPGRHAKTSDVRFEDYRPWGRPGSRRGSSPERRQQRWLEEYSEIKTTCAAGGLFDPRDGKRAGSHRRQTSDIRNHRQADVYVRRLTSTSLLPERLARRSSTTTCPLHPTPAPAASRYRQVHFVAGHAELHACGVIPSRHEVEPWAKCTLNIAISMYTARNNRDRGERPASSNSARPPRQTRLPTRAARTGIHRH